MLSQRTLLFPLACLITLIPLSAEAAPEWADPDHPEIDYSGTYGMLASENGFKEMMGWWAYGESGAAYSNIESLKSAANQSVLMREHDHTRFEAECVDGKLALVVTHAPGMGKGPDAFAVTDSGDIEVVYSVDGGEAHKTTWPDLFEGTSAGLRQDEAYRFMKVLEKADDLVLRMHSSDGSPLELNFALAGAEEAFAPVLEACGYE
ncbi:hypothetical protein A6D6_03236 [Alcanivorax xiamenensis]|uniref:Uncharacterized protein n=1 Tax=Alcanivorax xiamenensis TaxID=1177156 RepID=A0ABQ6Y5A8_9GAMM|nr:hypothetical protein [Alcanivorax xiamenensis]KAF0804240.1 hypothetical protein A6D6_03236 [Alcanivorax xiamenensis]